MIRTILLVVAVVAGWTVLTVAAAWAMPQRQDPDELPDLIYDEHWLLRTPPQPVEPDHLPARPTTTRPPPPSRPPTRGRSESANAPPTRAVAEGRASTAGDGCGGWRPLVSTYSWNVDTACRILLCESGGRPDAVGPVTRYGTARGLMQILPGGSFDPVVNMSQAWAKYSARGWQPWVCR